MSNLWGSLHNFEYLKGRSPVIELSNLQVVNGGQTLHALYEAFQEDPSTLEDIALLCRIYKTSNVQLTTNIAEYTNSQNPVKSRDIRSIDIIQQKLEAEFSARGLYYERKKNQHRDKPKSLRIDAEKTGQVLFAFFNESPSEAKNNKKVIFAEKYEDIFNDEITADKVLLAYRPFEKIEVEKNAVRASIANDDMNASSKDFFLLYTSYFILYILGQLARLSDVELNHSNFERIWNMYDEAVEIVRDVIKTEKATLGENVEYSDAQFFKTQKPKKHFEDHMLHKLHQE